MRLTHSGLRHPAARWRVVPAGVLGAGLLLAPWPGDFRAPSPVEEAAAPAASAPLVVAAPPVPRREPPPRPLPRSAAPAAPLPARAASLAESGDCGRATTEAGEPDAAAAERGRRDRRDRWLEAMEGSADERVRAAGWVIGMGSDRDRLRDRLATLAATSADPLVQAQATRACRGEAALSSACQALSPDTWATLEPDNAAAWLALAADPRVEPARQLGALQRAAQAGRFDNHSTTLHTLAQAAQPAGVDDVDRLAMARDVVAARADWLGTEALRLHCSSGALREEGPAAPCEALAAMLVQRAQTVPDLRQAHELGQRLGWPAERLDALRDETVALEALERRQVVAAESGDCAALASSSAFFADVGRLGAVGALRQAAQPPPAR